MEQDPLLTPLERRLVKLLRWGTWIATAVVAAGFAMSLINPYLGSPSQALPATQVASLGIALFIALPVLGVLVMLTSFLHARDFLYSAIAGLVLVIIITGFALGTLHGSKPSGEKGHRVAESHNQERAR